MSKVWAASRFTCGTPLRKWRFYGEWASTCSTSVVENKPGRDDRSGTGVDCMPDFEGSVIE